MRNQRLNTNDPAVAEFVRQCGLAKHAVSIRLIGVEREDVQVQIDRLNKALGELVVWTRVQPTRDSRGYCAYGTILG
ncbi:MAG: hypothetical protein IPP13_18790 [Kouleothrix sp.]|jgi:hypothetical protein|nr:hypothetical protein [Kouleothrix sp.]